MIVLPSGMKYGKLKIVGVYSCMYKGEVIYSCVCDCGASSIATHSDLITGKLTKCKDCQ